VRIHISGVSAPLWMVVG